MSKHEHRSAYRPRHRLFTSLGCYVEVLQVHSMSPDARSVKVAIKAACGGAAHTRCVR